MGKFEVGNKVIVNENLRTYQGNIFIADNMLSRVGDVLEIIVGSGEYNISVVKLDDRFIYPIECLTDITYRPLPVPSDDSSYICQHCGDRYRLSEGGNSEYCEHCYDELYVTCEHCASEVLEENCYINSNDEIICYDCYDSYYTTCYNCGAIVETSDTTYIADVNNRICDNCRDEQYRMCHSCHEWHNVDDMYWSYYHSGYLCIDCYDSECSVVHDYSYKPTPIFYKTEIDEQSRCENESSTLLYLGVELELDEGCDSFSTAEKVHNIVNARHEHIYIKEDGSLDNGLEFVSHPSTLDYHQTRINWNAVQEIASNNEFLDNESCGCHIHINKQWLRQSSELNLEIFKIIILLKKFQKPLYKFANRNKLTYCRPITDEMLWFVYPNEQTPITDIMIDRFIGNYDDNEGRYCLLNNRNSNTLEFRLFSSTVQLYDLYGYMEFVEGLVRYTKSHSLAEIQEVSSLLQVFESDTKKYDNVIRMINDRI